MLRTPGGGGPRSRPVPGRRPGHRAFPRYLRRADTPGRSGRPRDEGRSPLTNPKIILFFAAFLPQFARGGRGPAALQFLALGLIFLIVGLAWDSLVGLSAGRLGGALKSNGHAATAVTVAAGVTFAILALLLFLQALPV